MISTGPNHKKPIPKSIIFLSLDMTWVKCKFWDFLCPFHPPGKNSKSNSTLFLDRLHNFRLHLNFLFLHLYVITSKSTDVEPWCLYGKGKFESGRQSFQPIFLHKLTLKIFITLTHHEHNPIKKIKELAFIKALAKII